MNWFTEILTGSGVAHSIFIYAIVIALGVVLGKIKVKGISLGATFVLFVGILAGHLGLEIDMNTLKFIQEFGLILFIFSIGLQVGPSFFSSFKHGGLLLNGLAVTIIFLNIAVALGIYFGIGGVRITDMVGILSGAITNTPGLGAAQQTLIETQGDAATALNESMSMGYAAAYPLGVVGIILSFIVLKAIFNIGIDKEAKEHGNKFVTNEREVAPVVKDYDFDALMAQFEQMVGDLMGKDQTYYSPRITQIIEKYLGKGKKMSGVTRDQAELVYLVVTEINDDLVNGTKK